jgi:hypothetical protein
MGASDRPSFQFYPQDWLSDEALSACSMAAQGLWIRMLCLMHKSERRGFLMVGGKPPTEKQLSRMLYSSQNWIQKWIMELTLTGVLSVDKTTGCIYSRRMVKDEHIRCVRAKAGKLGGNPLLVDLHKQTVKQTSNQTPTPSSSSSSSSSVGVPTPSPDKPAGRRKDTGKKRPPNPYWDAVCDLWGLKPVGTAKGRIGRLAANFKAHCDADGVGPEEIGVRRDRIAAAWKDSTKATPEAVEKHWDAFAASGPAFERRYPTPEEEEQIMAVEPSGLPRL